MSKAATATRSRYLDYVRLDEVQFAPRNPQGHDDEGLDRSIGHFGFVDVPTRGRPATAPLRRVSSAKEGSSPW